jgi:hypothetical protein
MFGTTAMAKAEEERADVRRAIGELQAFQKSSHEQQVARTAQVFERFDNEANDASEACEELTVAIGANMEVQVKEMKFCRGELGSFDSRMKKLSECQKEQGMTVSQVQSQVLELKARLNTLVDGGGNEARARAGVSKLLADHDREIRTLRADRNLVMAELADREAVPVSQPEEADDSVRGILNKDCDLYSEDGIESCLAWLTDRRTIKMEQSRDGWSVRCSGVVDMMSDEQCLRSVLKRLIRVVDMQEMQKEVVSESFEK